MSVYTIFQLTGMIVEVIGAFILAAEAIGTHRLRKWIKALSQTLDRLLGRIKSQGRIPSPRKFWITLMVTTSLVGFLFEDLLKKFVPEETHIPGWLSWILPGLAGGLCGGLMFLVAFFSVFGILKFLYYVNVRTRTRKAGLIGFLLLTLGFVLQFSGTLGQSVYNTLSGR